MSCAAQYCTGTRLQILTLSRIFLERPTTNQVVECNMRYSCFTDTVYPVQYAVQLYCSPVYREIPNITRPKYHYRAHTADDRTHG